MIILITGATHTGKTKLAQQLLERLHYPYLSIDHLKMGLIRSGNTDLTPDDDDELTDYLWPVVREWIKTAVENSQDLIVEGCYIPFDWRQDLDSEYLSKIKFICLAMTDEYIDAHFEDVKKHASDIESSLDDSDITPDLIKEYNHRNIAGFEGAGERIVLIDSSYDETVGKILEELT